MSNQPDDLPDWMKALKDKSARQSKQNDLPEWLKPGPANQPGQPVEASSQLRRLLLLAGVLLVLIGGAAILLLMIVDR